MKRSLPSTIAIAITMLTMGQPLRAQVQRAACCLVTAIGSPAGVVTAKENATGRTFEFQVPNPKLMPQIHVGTPVYANFSTMQVSLNGIADCCKIISIIPPPAAVAPAPAARPAPGGPATPNPLPPPASAPGAKPASVAPAAAAPPAPQRVSPPYVATPAAKPAPGAPSASAPGAPVTAPKIAPAAAPAATPMGAGAVQNKLAPNCTVTAININTGVVTAKENTTSKVFQFKLNDATQLNLLQVGAGVYANFGAGVVSMDGLSPNGTILSTPAAPAPPPPPAPARDTAPPPPPPSHPSGDSGQGGKAGQQKPQVQPSPSNTNTDPRTNFGIAADNSSQTVPEGSTEGAIRGVAAAPGQPSDARQPATLRVPAQPLPLPCCEVTAMDSHTSIGTAKENANGHTFEFQVTKPEMLRQIQSGTRIYTIGFKSKEVSLDDITPFGIVLGTKSTPPFNPIHPEMGAGAPTVLPGTLRDEKTKEPTPTTQPSSSSSSTGSSGVSSSSNAATVGGARPGMFIDAAKPTVTLPPRVSSLDCLPISVLEGSTKGAIRSVTANSFVSGASMSCRVSLDRPAPGGGLDAQGARTPGTAAAPPTKIQITTSNSAVASVPEGTVSILPGATTADFQVSTTAYPGPVDVTISASKEGSSPKSTNVTLTPAAIRTFGCENVPMGKMPSGDAGRSTCENVGGDRPSIAMNFSGPTPSGFVSLSSSSKAVSFCTPDFQNCSSSLAVPVQAGAKWEAWQLWTTPVAVPTTATLSALDPLSKLVKTVQLKINPPAPIGLEFCVLCNYHDSAYGYQAVTTISNVPVGGQQVRTVVHLNGGEPMTPITWDVKYSASDAAGNSLPGAVTGPSQYMVGTSGHQYCVYDFGPTCFTMTVQPCEVNAPCKVSVTVGSAVGTLYVNP